MEERESIWSKCRMVNNINGFIKLLESFSPQSRKEGAPEGELFQQNLYLFPSYV